MGTYHSKKDIDEVILNAVSHKWLYEKKGHRHVVGYLYCSEFSNNRCKVPINGTPQSPTGFAKKLRDLLAKCPHGYAIRRR